MTDRELTNHRGAVNRLRRRLLILLLLLSLAPAMGVKCFDDSEMIDRHQQKLDEEDE